MISKDESLKIIKASLGPRDLSGNTKELFNSGNITEKTKELYNSGTLIIRASKEVFGDPTPNVIKWLEIEYGYDGYNSTT